LTYQHDNEPGLAVRGDLDPYTENFITFMKTDFGVGIDEKKKSGEILSVSQNFPNPFSESSIIKVTMEKPAELTLEVMSLLGQKVLATQSISAKTGINTLTIDRKELSPGIYFYKVTGGNSSEIKKMIIE
jgi:hypothetical protein